MTYSLDWLLNQSEREPRQKFLMFWGHQPRKDGQTSASCFSQWWLAPFAVDGIVYPSAEHFMMAEKARLFHDTETLTKILACATPAEAKKLGRAVQNFVPEVWDAACYSIVVLGNTHKFAQNAPLSTFLLNTGSRILVESSPVDAIWGNGLAKDHPDAEIPARWPGKNLLGFALMEVRDQLIMA